LIITTESYVSFKNMGLMEELAESTQYVPNYVLKERYKKEAAALAQRKEKLEIARQLKANGVDVETIANSTGLTVEEVKKLRKRK
jgi:DNA repair protein RadC